MDRHLYLQSEELQRQIREISAAAEIQYGGKVRFEEMIALPFFGQIILRFDFVGAVEGLEELDRLENELRDLAGPDFLVDFMGSVYAAAGTDLSGLEERLPALSARYEKEKRPDSVHAHLLLKDASVLLREAGMDPGIPVWEIQIEQGRITLLTMGEIAKPASRVRAHGDLFIGSVSQRACTGLFRAALYAERSRLSLARVLA